MKKKTAILLAGTMIASTILAGVVALLISALLTAIYMMTVTVRAFFPGKDFDYSKLNGVKDPTWMMLLPFGLFVVAMIVFGVNAQPFVDFFTNIAMALM